MKYKMKFFKNIPKDVKVEFLEAVMGNFFDKVFFGQSLLWAKMAVSQRPQPCATPFYKPKFS